MGRRRDIRNLPYGVDCRLGTIHEQRGRQEFPILYDGSGTLTVSGRNFDDYASVYVDGRRVGGSVTLTGDEQEQVLVELDSLPAPGMHMLQVQAETGQGLTFMHVDFHLRNVLLLRESMQIKLYMKESENHNRILLTL